MTCTRSAILLSIILTGTLQAHAQGQAKAGTCIVAADFEDGLIPFGWTVEEVEQLDAQGAGTGTFVPGWWVGNASEANAAGFFPVADAPVGNRFIMANDDAPPCDCDMDTVRLTTASIDFTGRSGMALEGRYFHEQSLGAGNARIEVRGQGGEWLELAVLPAAPSVWQPFFLDLSAFDGNPDVQLRFSWSDGGEWSSGFALDDICLMDRLPRDLSIVQVYSHRPSASAFDPTLRSLRYSQLPAEQADSLRPTVDLMNRGQLVLGGVALTVTVDQGGNQQQVLVGPLSDLAPGERRTVELPSIALIAEPGTVTLTVATAIGMEDDDPTDNEGTASLQLTGPGWALGYGAMASDVGPSDGSLGGSEPFIVAQRMEIARPGSVAQGISAVLLGNADAGIEVRAVLFNSLFITVDTSSRYALTAADVEQGALGVPLFLPLSTTPALEPGDYFVGIQRLEGEGEVRVATAGLGPEGAAAVLSGPIFTIEYVERTPMVRLHVAEFGVGVEERGLSDELIQGVFPMPIMDVAQLSFVLGSSASVTVELTDLAGRTLQKTALGTLPVGQHRHTLHTDRFGPGIYLLTLRTRDRQQTLPIIIAR